MEKKKKKIHFVSFKRRTISSIAIALIVVGLIFCVYQVLMAKMIDEDERERLSFYRNIRNRNFGSMFKINQDDQYFICFPSGVKIAQNFLNDDYCDCPDGSDEPGTNACPQTTFKCHHKFKLVTLPSSRVNDGICDCCDGSDEYEASSPLIQMNFEIQKKTGVYLRPCPNVCPR